MEEDIKQEEGQTEAGCGPTNACQHCLKREQEEAEANELGFAILIALVPALTITLFSNLGLF